MIVQHLKMKIIHKIEINLLGKLLLLKQKLFSITKKAFNLYKNYQHRFNYGVNFLKARFLGLRKEVRFLLILSACSIILIELILNKIDAYYQIQYDLGIIYLKLCYSYFSAFVFYYLVVYAPRERKRLKGFRYVGNKVKTIGRLVDNIIRTLIMTKNYNFDEVVEITFENLNIRCKEINPHLPLLTIDGTYTNYYYFLSFQTSKINNFVRELIILNDVIDEDLFYGLTNINDKITLHLTFDYIPNNQTFGIVTFSLWELYEEKEEMLKKFKNSYEKKYSFQYHDFEMRQNVKRTQLYR